MRAEVFPHHTALCKDGDFLSNFGLWLTRNFYTARLSFSGLMGAGWTTSPPVVRAMIWLLFRA